jgi:hypothetical protein
MAKRSIFINDDISIDMGQKEDGYQNSNLIFEKYYCFYSKFYPYTGLLIPPNLAERGQPIYEGGESEGGG